MTDTTTKALQNAVNKAIDAEQATLIELDDYIDGLDDDELAKRFNAFLVASGDASRARLAQLSNIGNRSRNKRPGA
jgi:hypothetical protein